MNLKTKENVNKINAKKLKKENVELEHELEIVEKINLALELEVDPEFESKFNFKQNEEQEDEQEQVETIKESDADLYNLYVKDIGNYSLKEIEKGEEYELFKKIDLTNRSLNKKIFKNKTSEDLVALLDSYDKKTAIVTFYDIAEDKDENILLSKIKSLKEDLLKIKESNLTEKEKNELFQKTVENIKFDYGFLKYCIVKNPSLRELNKDLFFLRTAKDKIVSNNLKLVIKIAKNYKSSHLDFIDLIQEGNIGLIKGIDKFRYEMGYKLSTYVNWWIKQAINDSLTKKSRSIKLPSHIVNTLFKIKKFETNKNVSRDKLTIKELSKTLNISEDKIEKALDAPEETVSLDLVIGSDGDKDMNFGDLIASSEEFEPSYHLNKKEKQKEVIRMIETLDQREQIILKNRFGIGNEGNVKTLEEIGNMIGLTRERVRQIEGEAIKKLKTYKFYD